MLIMPSFKKSLIVEQFQGNYLKLLYIALTECLLIGEEPAVYFENKRNLQISFKLSASR